MISEAEKINREIRVVETKIDVIKENIITARVSAFRYFWPFLLLSIFGFVFGYLYIFVYCFSTPPDERTFSTTVGYSTIAVQEMNMAYKYPIIYWNCANLIVDSMSDEELDGSTN